MISIFQTLFSVQYNLLSQSVLSTQRVFFTISVS